MAKKKAASDFNMSKAISEILTENKKLSSKEALEALTAKYPTAKINKNSFSVAFYTGRKKLGIGSSGRGKKVANKVKIKGRPTMDIYALQTAAKFLTELGGAEPALEVIKQLQALQVK